MIFEDVIFLYLGETEMLQPIDSGVGSILKRIMGHIQDEWLDVEDHLLAWEGDPDAKIKLNASARRILITQWAGEAWERLTTDECYKDTIFKCFVRTGAMITVDESDDDKICPLAGLKGYTIPSIVELTNNAIPEDENSNIPASHENEDDNDNEEEGNEIFEDNTLDETNDSEVDNNSDTGIVPLNSQNEVNTVTTNLNIQSPDIDEEHENDLQDEEESWTLSVAEAASLKVPWRINDGEVPANFQRLPAYALVYADKEWNCIKIEKQNSDGTYRYKVEGMYEWGQHTFEGKDHGRHNESPNRWVSLSKQGIVRI
jgi:hypothetical protein